MIQFDDYFSDGLVQPPTIGSISLDFLDYPWIVNCGPVEGREPEVSSQGNFR